MEKAGSEEDPPPQCAVSVTQVVCAWEQEVRIVCKGMEPMIPRIFMLPEIGLGAVSVWFPPTVLPNPAQPLGVWERSF